MEKAVLTGDIILSKTIGDKAFLIKTLQKVFTDLAQQFTFDNPFDLYRGDSFQALLSNPKEALRIVFLIRLALRKANLWDARIGIGVGSVSFQQQDIRISNGEAFELSGKALEEIKNSTQRISIKTSNIDLNKQFNVMSLLSDAISKRWSKKTAEVLYIKLLNNRTQKEVAKELHISQSAVQQRMAAADFNAISTYIHYFEGFFSKHKER